VSGRQLELFPFGTTEDLGPEKPPLRAEAPLSEALPLFEKYMRQREFSAHTVRAFLHDIKLFLEFIGPETPLRACSTKTLQSFLYYLRYERGVPCSPKSLDRRLTTLKTFFGWLFREGVLPVDPAASLARGPVSSPLPRILSEEQIAAVLSLTREMRDAPEAPDARPHLLISLLLETGIKKTECMRIALSHIDLSDPERPTVYIHYDKPRQRFKSRRLPLPRDWPETLRKYLRRYQPKEQLFECTPRNLEYVLHQVSTLAGLPLRMTFEMLRWTSAVRDYKAGMEPEQLRQKLGLSRISWRVTLPVIQKLAESSSEKLVG